MTKSTPGVLIVGTSSDAGKSTIVAGLLRWCALRGVKAAPFKGQNMALNSAVTVDGGEIGRAQAFQARAAKVPAVVDFNPVLIKPTAPGRSQLVVHGVAVGELTAERWLEGRKHLMGEVLESFERVKSSCDLVIAEGAGSAGEINLLEGDITNLGFAAAAELRAVLVGDIDRGGVFASIYGHYRVVPEALSKLYSGFLINRVRGNIGLVESGARELAVRLSTRCFGLVPYSDLVFPAEDSLGRDHLRHKGMGRVGSLQVRIVALPYLANASDFDPLFLEEDLDVDFTSGGSDILTADLVILPGTKATVDDLDWLRDRGIAELLIQRHRAGGAILGVCGGFQMLTRFIDDPIESCKGRVLGLDLVPGEVHFVDPKVVRVVEARAPWLGVDAIGGYQIHHGRVSVDGPPMFDVGDEVEGYIGSDGVMGTTMHGIFDSDAFRAMFLSRLAQRSRSGFRSSLLYHDLVESKLDAFAEVLDRHLDVAALLGLG
ncbi:MAG: cobyric acid synthase [Ferrimicrobium sp.]